MTPSPSDAFESVRFGLPLSGAASFLCIAGYFAYHFFRFFNVVRPVEDRRPVAACELPRAECCGEVQDTGADDLYAGRGYEVPDGVVRLQSPRRVPVRESLRSPIPSP